MKRLGRGILLGAIATGLLCLPYVPYVTDDTYIHMQFARHLAQGQGFSFNAGTPTYGFTSPLWVMLLALFERAQIDLLIASKLLGFLFLVAGVWAMARLAEELVPDPWARFAAVGAWAVNVWSVRWGISGMETPLAVFLVTLGIAEHLRARRTGSWPWSSAALLALAALVRPEALGLVGLAGLDHVWHWLRPAEVPRSFPASRSARSAGASPESQSRRVLPLATFAVVVLGVLAPWAIYAMEAFGQFFPNTAYAKAGTFELAPAEVVRIAIREAKILGASSGLEMLLVALAGVGALIMAPGRVYDWVRQNFVPVSWLIALPALYAVRGSVLVSRYLLPVVPVLLCFGFTALGYLIVKSRRSLRLRKRAPFALLALVVVQNLLVTFGTAWPSAMSFTRGMHECLLPIGVWLRENTDPSATVAVPDIGALGYVSERRIVDLSGLVTPEMIAPQEARSLDEFVSSFGFAEVARPDYLVDRYTAPDRFADDARFEGVVRMLFHHKMGPLGIARADDYYYTVYAIDWAAFDERFPDGLVH